MSKLSDLIEAQIRATENAQGFVLTPTDFDLLRNSLTDFVAEGAYMFVVGAKKHGTKNYQMQGKDGVQELSNELIEAWFYLSVIKRKPAGS